MNHVEDVINITNCNKQNAPTFQKSTKFEAFYINLKKIWILFGMCPIRQLAWWNHQPTVQTKNNKILTNEKCSKIEMYWWWHISNKNFLVTTCGTWKGESWSSPGACSSGWSMYPRGMVLVYVWKHCKPQKFPALKTVLLNFTSTRVAQLRILRFLCCLFFKVSK